MFDVFYMVLLMFRCRSATFSTDHVERRRKCVVTSLLTILNTEVKSCFGDIAVAVAVYLHENKVLRINEYKQKYEIHHANKARSRNL